MLSYSKIAFASLLVAALEGSSSAFTASSNHLHNQQQQQQQYATKTVLRMQPDGDASADTSVSSRRSILQQSVLMAAGSLVMGFPAVASASDATTASSIAGGKIQFGEDSLMAPKAHGTSAQPVQEELLYGVNNKLADKICNFNRHFAENGGYFRYTSFEDAVFDAKGPITFYDSVTGKALFVAPLNRSAEDFVKESEVHGWPSFRDEEVVWENVRVLKSSGETVSVDGTHLGHNLPDRTGNRYCINLVSVAGQPKIA